MFIARQPIFNKSMKIYGYELLFRANSTANAFSGADSNLATAVVFGGLFEQGIDTVVGKAKAFVNFDYEFLMSDAIELINPDTLVIEVLETVEVDNILVERIRYLRRQGYKIALDDFEESLLEYPIVPLADIIKYDIIVTPLETIRKDVKEAIGQNKILLAEKIETEDEFRQAREMGFHLFQGYFFSRPNIVVGGPNARKTPRMIYASLLAELRKEEPSYDRLTRMIQSDVNLSYRLMRLISRKKEESQYRTLRNALVRMGIVKMERWVNVLMLEEVARGKPDELLRLSLVRSKFSEYIAEHSRFRSRQDEVSMMCLFSLLDVIMEIPMAEVLEGMFISEDIKDALIYGKGVFKPICYLVSAYEKGDWTVVDTYADEIEMDTDKLYQGYLASIQWAAQIVEMPE